MQALSLVWQSQPMVQTLHCRASRNVTMRRGPNA